MKSDSNSGRRYDKYVTPLDFEDARECVVREVSAARSLGGTEKCSLEECDGRILAEAIRADRDYPTLARSVRDGFAVYAADFPGRARVAGEVRAGGRYSGSVPPGNAIEIMTGAPLPEGPDAVIMIEHTHRDGEWVVSDRKPAPGDFVNPQGAECRAGDVLMPVGAKIGYADIAMAATVGRSSMEVYRRPVVAILATGDEIVEIEETPAEHQIRNSNSYSLAAQVRRAGGIPKILPVARDNDESTRKLIEAGLAADLLLLSGGVSAGKYDIVEIVLAGLGARFFFDRVRIQPGQPLVFGEARGKFFFGLPGNPASTMVTFELFGRAALELLSGRQEAPLLMPTARLTKDFRHKTGLTRFLPARVSGDGSELTPLGWTGSSDVPSLAKANCFVVAERDREAWTKGEQIRFLPK